MRPPTLDRSGCAATRHGDRKAYDLHRCRCPAARTDHARYEKRRRIDKQLGRARLIDATGTRRRLHALMALGWSSDTLAVKIGYTDGFAVRKLCRNRFVRRCTANRVARLYTALADTPGPSERVRRWAQTAGLLPPLWWDDDTIDDPSHVPPLREHPRRSEPVDAVVVDRLIHGTYTGCASPQERRAALHRLIVSDVPYDEIQRRLGLSGTTMRLYLDRADAAGITDDGQAA